MTTVPAPPFPPAPPPHSGETYRLTLPNTASAPKVARDFVGSLLVISRHGPLADDARLCVSEVVTNAHRHTRSPQIRVEVTVHRERITVAVRDDRPWALPVAAAPGPDTEREGGRGVSLVESLATAWGTTVQGGRSPGGKAVWFTLAAPSGRG
ncbi:ATP-binding protein [Streptomyces sp. NPDC095613]|uniref:ATP-binding protein n=1 Tax=Streptomyces sp. NPDC095613 TaxID=3155540 RepID=UPI00331B9562